ncbi:DNA-binding response regulator [Klebsiella sp. BIGb0407]|uniref:DNA-binding response regulator n=1 Tax=Klebsiella sp. BIGb0407 TaxID=2940603 RepID=UPI00216A7222|nr:DNA-binding response regulator [Klebsiella sp. BIGb0407]MCS3430276.1 DNA-binding NarL/FixJ family response regulator [Klebsiella sp. BIGb0407]
MVADFSPCEEKFAFSKFEAFSQLIDTLRLPAQEDEQRCILCDIDSLPDERINALHTIKECYCEKNQQLVLLLGKNNISLFFALHTIFPEASWLLKHESLDDLLRFIQNTDSSAEEKVFFSHSLINYTRQAWLKRDFNNSISGDDWWLMEEILKGKSLSQISAEQEIDVRRLSRCKRELMKKLNAKNNVELFSIFKQIIETPSA